MSSFIGNALWKVGSAVSGIPTTVEGALDMMKREPTNADVQAEVAGTLWGLTVGRWAHHNPRPEAHAQRKGLIYCSGETVFPPHSDIAHDPHQPSRGRYE